ncbi:MAG TPA: hypothetical protein VFM18_07235 [Methanosarcina sp.]|nr:hypothetical protein [Methanosarcina sp.]
MSEQDMMENLKKIASVCGFTISGWTDVNGVLQSDIGENDSVVLWNPYLDLHDAIELSIRLSIYLFPDTETNSISSSFSFDRKDGFKEVMTLTTEYYPNKIQTMRDLICESALLMYQEPLESE